MADLKISALPASTTPLAGTEVLPIVQSSATKQVSVANLTAGRAISATQITLTAGNVIPANGFGIDFSATPGTGTSELLADYEEGTWTPTRNGFVEILGAGSITTSGTYTKVGRLVTVVATITPAGGATIAATSGAGSFLSGLPFTCATPTSATWVDSSSIADDGGVLVNATELYVATAWVASINVHRFSATYFV